MKFLKVADFGLRTLTNNLLFFFLFHFSMQYPTNKQTMQILKNYIEKQKEKNLVPSDNLITIEKDKNLIIINSCFGTKVNETLAVLVSGLISARIGSSLAINSDAYRIIIETPIDIKTEIIKEIFLKTDLNTLEELLKKILKGSSHFKWNFLHTAKKFGVIEKNADYRNIKIEKIIEIYKDSILYEEAINKTMFEVLDLEKTKKVIKKVKNGEIEIKEDKISPIGIFGKDTRNLIVPERIDRTILLALKKRLEEKNIVLFCLNCKKERRVKVKELEEKIKCKYCSAKLVACISKFKKSNEKKLRKNANLIFSYGKKAILCLSARGIAEEFAQRILSKYYENEEEFLREVLRAEINYAKTRRFW